MTKNLKKHYDYLYSQIKKDIFSKKLEARLKLFWKLLNTQLQNVTTEGINNIYILLQIEFGNLAWGKLQQEIEDIILKIFLKKEKTIEIWGDVKFEGDRIENVKVIHIPGKFILSESKILLKKIAYHYNKLRFNPLIEEIYRLPEGLVRATSGDTKELMERIEKNKKKNRLAKDDPSLLLYIDIIEKIVLVEIADGKPNITDICNRLNKNSSSLYDRFYKWMKRNPDLYEKIKLEIKQNLTK